MGFLNKWREIVLKRMFAPKSLGVVFADGAVSENTYKSKLSQLKKQEAALLKCRHNIDPLELTELATLEARIAMVKDVLNQDTLSVSEFGIFGELGSEYIPAGNVKYFVRCYRPRKTNMLS